ncbi:MAG: hypothetical protein ACP5NK_05240 [Thermoplasmata archaeon]
MEKFQNETRLRELVLSHLARQEDSIAGIIKYLSTEGIKVHRLVLTGYLNSMVDSGELKERLMRPSRVFTSQTPANHDIYYNVGKIAKIVDENNEGDVALQTLFSIFGRPIFMREIERCSITFPKKYRTVSSPMRSVYLKAVEKYGIMIPQNNELIEPESISQNVIFRMFRELIFQSMNIGNPSSMDNEFQKTLD